jgi:hypothetical protein
VIQVTFLGLVLGLAAGWLIELGQLLDELI